MPDAYVLMTAMPPTKGHMRLIEFAHQLGNKVIVLFCAQPDEPYVDERYFALREATERLRNVSVRVYFQEVPQTPELHPDGADAFWAMWREILRHHDFLDGDYIVASEPYGAKLAEVCGGIFMPFDPNRELTPCRATDIRGDVLEHFDKILPEFQEYLKMRVTVFGAESTGKTTLSRALAKWGYYSQGRWLFEYARPYLETVGSELTTESMTAIWKGQLALQESASFLQDKPFIIQDTDLFSTVGYWDMWNGRTPGGLLFDACNSKSELYLITQSNIPFEPDPLRYGGDKRESDDQYWIDLCERYELNYVVLKSDDIDGRYMEASDIIRRHFKETRRLAYTRLGQ